MLEEHGFVTQTAGGTVSAAVGSNRIDVRDAADSTREHQDRHKQGLTILAPSAQ
jgi:hypothetical protein